MEFSTRDGVRINYEKAEGAIPTLVFLHGWATNKTSWDLIEERVANAYVTPDLRGHGRSEKPTTSEAYDLERFEEDVIDLLDHEKIERCVLVGHSMGGMIALMTRDPRIEGLVLLNTSAGIHDRIPIGPGPFLSRIGRFFEEHQNLVPSDLSNEYQNDFATFMRGLSGTSPIAMIHCFEEMYDLDASERLEQIDTPTLIIAGKNDHVLPKRFSEALADISDSRLELVETNHFSIIKDAETIAKLINGFVQSL